MGDLRIIVAAIVLAAASSAARAQETIYRAGDPGVTLPKLVRSVGPHYTSEAMRARIEGKVGLEATVTTEGTVEDIQVVRSLDKLYGLDDSAVNAAKQWRFEPGTKDGKPVAVRVTIDMAFTMGGKGRRR